MRVLGHIQLDRPITVHGRDIRILLVHAPQPDELSEWRKIDALYRGGNSDEGFRLALAQCCRIDPEIVQRLAVSDVLKVVTVLRRAIAEWREELSCDV